MGQWFMAAKTKFLGNLEDEMVRTLKLMKLVEQNKFLSSKLVAFIFFSDV